MSQRILSLEQPSTPDKNRRVPRKILDVDKENDDAEPDNSRNDNEDDENNKENEQDNGTDDDDDKASRQKRGREQKVSNSQDRRYVQATTSPMPSMQWRQIRNLFEL